MSLTFFDSKAHYTTTAQANTKYAAGVGPSAGQGAFGAPGSKFNGEQYNLGAVSTSEVAFYYTGDNGFGQWIVFRDSTANQVWVDWMGDGAIKFWSSTRGTLLGTVAAGTVQLNVQNHFRIKIAYHSSAGTIDVWLNGALVLSLTGKNTSPNAGNQATNVLTFSANSSNVAGGYFSHFAHANASGDLAGQQRTTAVFPTGAGSHSDFTPSTGSNWQNVDEVTPNDDTDYNESNTSGHIDTFTHQALPANTDTIGAFAVTCRAEKTDANSLLVYAVLTIGGVDYVHPTGKGIPAASYAFLQWIWTVSPATGVAFTVAEVNAMHYGYKIV